MDQRFSLQGKVAVVTGANGTFGSEFCRTFAEAGADIVLAVRTAEKGEAVAEAKKATAVAAEPKAEPAKTSGGFDLDDWLTNL